MRDPTTGAALNADYGVPEGLCREVPPAGPAGAGAAAGGGGGSGVFVREWSKAKITMDCGSYTPTITMKTL